MAKNTKKTDDSILIRGIRLSKNAVYEVSHKTPSDGAPDLYKKLGSEKISAPKGVIMNAVGFPFVDGVWDTGLYPNSPVFREEGLSLEQAELQAEANREFILEPLRKAGLSRLVEKLENYEDESSEFFNSEVLVPLSIGNQFNTGDPRSRLALYAAILSGELAPKGKAQKDRKEKGERDESDFLYTNAQYTITSQTETRTVKEQRELNNNKARGIFWSMLENDKEGLIGIMNYEGISASESDPETALNGVISKYFESYENIDSFLDTYEKYKEDPKFKEELKIMNILLNEKGLKYLERDGRQYMLKGKELGTTPKTVAKSIANDTKTSVEFFKLIDI